MPEAPKPYVYNFTPCATHGKSNCPLCATAVPNPVLTDVAIPSATTTEGVIPPPAPPPLINPKAQKKVEAARSYAAAVEAAAVISDQLEQARELVATLQTKYEETLKTVDTALKETQA